MLLANGDSLTQEKESKQPDHTERIDMTDSLYLTPAACATREVESSSLSLGVLL
jgi:hypothetical protein